MIIRNTELNIKIPGYKDQLFTAYISCKAVSDNGIKFKCEGECNDCTHCEVDIYGSRLVYPINYSNHITELINDSVNKTTKRLKLHYRFYKENQDMYFKLNEINKKLDEFKLDILLIDDEESRKKYVELHRRFDIMREKYIDMYLDLANETNYVYYRTGYKYEKAYLLRDISELYNHVSALLHLTIEVQEEEDENN